MLKAGHLKIELSVLKGYRDQWFVLTHDGYLQYFKVRMIKLIAY